MLGVTPLGTHELAQQIRDLGVVPGGVLMVHASLRRLGPVAGGAAGVVESLRAALGPDGTLLGYAATPENSTTSRLFREATAGMDAEKLQRHLDELPAFDPATTPCSPTLGALAETIRRLPGSRRSSHPQTSFAAVGPRAAELTAVHELAEHLGPRSPLGALYERDGQALLIGVGHEVLTAYHLADYLLPLERRRFKSYQAKVRAADGTARWVRFDGLDLDDTWFAALGREVEERVPVARGGPGLLLVPVRPAVDAAREILAEGLLDRVGV